MLISRLHKPGDLIRHDQPGGGWYEARLRFREHRDGLDGWMVEVTNNGTYAPEILSTMQHLTEQQMTPISGRRLPVKVNISLVLCLLIAVALVIVSGVGFLRDDTLAGVQGLAAALVVIVVTGLYARRWRRLS